MLPNAPRLVAQQSWQGFPASAFWVQVLACTSVIFAVFYLPTGLAGCSMDPGINRGTRKLARTSRVIKKKKKGCAAKLHKDLFKTFRMECVLPFPPWLFSIFFFYQPAELSCNFCVVFLTVIITCPRVLFIVFLWLIFNIVENEIKKIRWRFLLREPQSPFAMCYVSPDWNQVRKGNSNVKNIKLI